MKYFEDTVNSDGMNHRTTLPYCKSERTQTFTGPHVGAWLIYLYVSFCKSGEYEVFLITF